MIVFKYGALKPTVVGGSFEDLLEYQKLSTRYYNDRVEVERWKAAAKHAAYVLDEDLKEEIRVAYNEATRINNNKYSLLGLGWGQRQAEDDAINSAIKDSFSDERKAWGKIARRKAKGLPPLSFLRSCKRVARPKFRFHDGEGFLQATLQSTSGISTSQLLTQKNVRLEGSGKKRTVVLRLSEKIVVRVPIIYHRELPVDALLTSARVTVNRIGNRWVYSVQFAVRSERTGVVPTGTGSCAVNFGWKKLPNGVRVASAVADDGSTIECIMPNSIIERLRHAEDVRSLADRLAVDYIGSSKDRAKTREKTLSDSASVNRELGKLHGTPQSLEHWARRDRHLYQWERDEYAHALRSRDALYIKWAQDLARKFANVKIETFNFQQVIERLDGEPKIEASHYRFLAAPSYLRLSVGKVFGDALEKLHKEKKTVFCLECGTENAAVKSSKKKTSVVKCERCGAELVSGAKVSVNKPVTKKAKSTKRTLSQTASQVCEIT